MLCACAVAAPALPEGATELKDVTAVKAVRVSNSGLNQRAAGSTLGPTTVSGFIQAGIASHIAQQGTRGPT